MDLLIKIISVCIWPAIVFLVALVFRSQLISLLNRISSGKLGKIEINFDKATTNQLLLQIDFLEEIKDEKTRLETIKKITTILPYLNKLSPHSIAMLLSSFTGGGHSFNHSYYLSSKEIFDNLENSGMVEIIKIPISDTEYNYIPLLLGDGLILLKAFGFTSEHLKSVQKCQRDFISKLLNDHSTMKSISVKSVMDKKISIDVLNM